MLFTASLIGQNSDILHAVGIRDLQRKTEAKVEAKPTAIVAALKCA
jgi:hypothetical protein